MKVEKSKLVRVTYPDTIVVDDPNSNVLYTGYQRGDTKGSYDMLEEILRSSAERGKPVKNLREYLSTMHYLWLLDMIGVKNIPVVFSLSIEVVEE